MLKGGARKSTTAMLLAFALAERNEHVMVVDADHGTQGVTDWATRVYATGGELPFDVVQWTPRLGLLVPFVQQQQHETGAGRVLVDVGGEAPEVLRQVILAASLVIAPGGAEQGELSRLPATASIVQPTRVPMLVLLTRVPAPGAGSARDARAALTDEGYTVLATEVEQNRERYAHVWGTVPPTVGAYGQLADELLKGDR
jgi:hypothetical protein